MYRNIFSFFYCFLVVDSHIKNPYIHHSSLLGRKIGVHPNPAEVPGRKVWENEAPKLQAVIKAGEMRLKSQTIYSLGKDSAIN